MKVLLSWLRELCPVELEAEELAHLLTSRGAKVESAVRPWAGLEDVVVARVMDVRDHPNSDKLCLARVDTGTVQRELVVGVRNMTPGDLVPLAAPGARVPGLPDPLTPREIRGVVSEGMLCSPRELAISADHGGILILPSGTPLGADVKSTFGLDDVLFDIEVTPNRPDLLSVLGVAREVAAATGVPCRHPDTTVAESDRPAAEVATVEIDDLERCPRYLARLITGVSVGPSPVQVQARLFASGVRPLSNVVDATNYVLLETGQPLHPFDLATLAGPGIVVRRAAQGERFVTLDGVERGMTSEDLMIADRERSVAVAGIMGGASSEVSDLTRDVLLESASFQAVGVLRTARRLGIRTEASIRFERGVDPEAVPGAGARAAALMAAWAGGTVLSGAVESGGPPPRRTVGVRPARAVKLLGYPVSATDVERVFDRLGMSTTELADQVDVEIPGYRPDLEGEVDLIEEVARVQGYDRVGSTMPAARQAGGVPETYRRRRRVREVLVRAGLRETWSMSFASPADLDLTGRPGVRVANPLASDQAFLRTSLTPGILRALRTNVARQVRTAALFEVGRVFGLNGDGEGGVEEREAMAFGMTGPSSPGYPGERRDLDVSDARGTVEALLAGLGIRTWRLDPAPGSGGLMHPSRSAVLLLGADAERAGEFGELHPRLAAAMDLPARVALAEFDLDVLGRHGGWDFQFREIARFPPIHRDLAFVVDAATPAGEVAHAIQEAGGELVGGVTLFDVFTGGPVPAGKKSLAYAVEFRSAERTLTDQEADGAVRAVVDRLASAFGAQLRSG